ncbi:MAG: hypothetical protein OXI90_13010 [Gammaproteobacteria bacterium]|nr:hypothetical protein [Gammaproteobacteria bacterium]
MTLNRSALLRACFPLLFAALLAGCPQRPPDEIEEQPPPPPVEPPDVNPILDRAETAFSEERLIGTPGAAHSLYLEVLEIDRDNPDALYGIERITEAFIQRARDAIRQERWTVAGLLLDQAARADADHPSLPSAKAQLRQLRDAERLQLDLGRDEVRGRRQSVAGELAAFGAHARKPNARVIIRAGSDVEGRWIYARLNDAPGDRRIRGEIVIGYPPRVVIFLLPGATP